MTYREPMDSYLSYFTPGQMSHETLEFIFVKRHKLAERLVDRVAQSATTGAKYHSLLLGPRGMGKSHLVALVYHRVRAREDLRDKVVLAWLAEEEWGVSSLAEFYLVVLRALATEYPDAGLTATIAALKRLPHKEIADAAARAIREFANGRTLVLLMENLEEIFRGLGSDGQWSLRSFLSEDPFVTILATTPTLFSGIQNQNQAFYGFFAPTYLDELNADEAVELLERVAEFREDSELTDYLKTDAARDRVRAVNDLAGGHPRVYLLFAHLLTKPKLDELVTPFLELLDELTPYYQSRLQLLAPQQRKIVEYLCDRRGAVQVKEIAADTLLSQNAAAAQLGELEKMGYVRKTPVGRSSYNELREPLLRMVIEIKRTRNREPIRLIVDFFRRWYSRHERRARLLSLDPSDTFSRAYYEAALDLSLAHLDRPDPSRAKQKFPDYKKAVDRNDMAHAVDIAAEIIEYKGSEVEPEDYHNLMMCLLWHSSDEEITKIVNLIVNFCNIELERYNSSAKSDDEFKRNFNILWKSTAWAGTIPSSKHLHEKQNLVQKIRIQSDKLIKDYDESTSSNGLKRMRMATHYMFMSMACIYAGLTEESLTFARRASEFGLYSDYIWMQRAWINLMANRFDDFLKYVDESLDVALLFTDIGVLSKYVRIVLNELISMIDLLPENLVNHLSGLFISHNKVDLLLQGFIESLGTIISKYVSQNKAEAWRDAWDAAGEGHPELDLPRRLLHAAVAWKKDRDPRHLLALPIEERRILESMLPEEARTENAG